MSATGLTIAFVIALSADAAFAQVRVVRYGDDRLVGIDEVDVLVTGTLAQNGCAVTKSAVQERAVAALRAAAITTTVSAQERSWSYSIVIDLHVDRAGPRCAAAIATELVAEVAGIPEADRRLPPGRWGSLLVGPMPLIRDNGLVISPGVAHDATVQRAIEAQVVTIAARIRSANP